MQLDIVDVTCLQAFRVDDMDLQDLMPLVYTMAHKLVMVPCLCCSSKRPFVKGQHG